MNYRNLLQKIAEETAKALHSIYGKHISPAQLSFQETRKDFEGDVTLTVFSLTSLSEKSPEQTASDIGTWLKEHCTEVREFNVVKGFLNLLFSDNAWLSILHDAMGDKRYGLASSTQPGLVMVEYSSPNTNKPLHLGHIRNNLLGFSVSEILKATGKKVVKVNLVNDRGIHICKSMLAWKKWGHGETPASSGIKGDHLVGKYYVEFDKHYKIEIEALKKSGKSQEDAERNAPLILEAHEMLRKWEAGEQETVSLWKTMNAWVYAGFDETYRCLGVDFDKIYYESETYLLGKKIVDEGLAKGVLFQKTDGSVWIDLSAEGLDQKLLLRSDGTSVYMTQDLGTAEMRHKEYNFDTLIYVVGNEQDYHFKVLQHILQKMGYKWANGLYHLSYGMVELPEGKMKSREGTVVDADDLIKQMVETAKELTQELGKTEGLSNDEACRLYEVIALGALKYFILKVDPKKKMMFNPRESVDFTGNTGPFIQYTYARISSLKRKAGASSAFAVYAEKPIPLSAELHQKERTLLACLAKFPLVVADAGKDYSPAHLANYVYDLAKNYNQFYHECPVLNEEERETSFLRLRLSALTGEVIKRALHMLGIEAPERM